MLFNKVKLSLLFLFAFAACSFAQSTTTYNWANFAAVMNGGYTDITLGADLSPSGTPSIINPNPAASYTVNGSSHNFSNTTGTSRNFFQVNNGQTATLKGINFVNTSNFNASNRILLNGGTTYLQNITASTNSFAAVALANAGALNLIRNQPGAVLLDISNSAFSYTTASSNGALGTVIYNNSTAGTMNITSTIFQSNTAGAAANANGSLGGAIYNVTGATAFIDGSAFNQNRALGSSSMGGAIYNSGTMIINSSSFSANGLGQAGAVRGGAIYNAPDATLDITGTNGASSFTGNVAASANSRGGAIDNEAVMTITDANFSGNTVGTASNGGDYGGAIYNAGDLTVTDANFDSNKALSPTALLSHGGAIASDGILTVQAENSDIIFNGNTATGQGGAIRIGATGTLNLTADNKDITFSNNAAGTSGGAIQGVAGSTLNLTANNGNIIFTNNYSGNYGGSANGLNIGSTANLNVVNGDIIFNDGISSSLSTPALPVNLNISGTNGNVVLNADMRGNGSATSPLGYNGNITLNSGTIKIVNPTWFFNSPFIGNGGTLDRQGETTALGTPLNISNFTLNNDVNTKIDVDLASATGSYFAGAPAGTGKIMISDIKLLSNVNATTEVPVADAAAEDSLGLSNNYVLNGAIYTYNVSYETSTANGFLLFNPIRFSPSSYIPQVSMQTGGYYNQLNAYSMVFDYLGTFNPGDPDAERCSSYGLWLRPYAYTERVNFKDGIKVDNTFMGAYLGFDTRKYSIGSDFYTGFSIFGGYNQGGQDYTSVDIDQQSITLGAAAALYKGNFFTGLTVSGSKGTADATTYGVGDESLDLSTLGIALKAGYNARLSSIFILQPALTLSYTNVGLGDYTNAYGLRVSADDLAPIAVEPSVKLLASLSEKMYAQAVLSYVYNTNDKSKATMDGTLLPQIYINNYLQYSVGLTRLFNEHFSAGLNLYARNLDKDSLGAVLDIRFLFGKLCFWGKPAKGQTKMFEENEEETKATVRPIAAAETSNNEVKPEPAAAEASPAPAATEETGTETAAALAAGAEIAGPMLFDFDSSSLKPQTIAQLKKIAQKLQDGDYKSIVVEGHTDGIGTDAYNMALGLRRAEAGRRYLIQLGVDGSRITIKSYGKKRPIATNDTAEGRAQNRRIEVTITIM
ncbi:MAG: OmpA family protein [Oscillospiraceae bacterium]|nr:OmpA family protein [Oscillospiraceae bacterium]